MKTILKVTAIFTLSSIGFYIHAKSVLTVKEDISLQLHKLDKFIRIEHSKSSIDVSRKYFVDVSETIYPFINNYKLQISKDYKRPILNSIELHVSYYYTQDSTVKLILYSWKEPSRGLSSFNEEEISTAISSYSNKNQHKSARAFENKFNEITTYINYKLGSYKSANFESNTITSNNTYRDDIHWNTESINAYLYRFGDKKNSFNEINLAIYKD